jgi:hypothetical protein
MSRTITITLPDYLVEHLEILAGIQQKTLEETVLAKLDQPDELFSVSTSQPETAEDLLESLKRYSDDALWKVVQTTLTLPEEQRLNTLMEAIKSGISLSVTEEKEYQILHQMVMTQMLRRSAALVHLKERGYDVREFFQGNAG